MNAGPWTSYKQIEAAYTGMNVNHINGRKPVAVERRNGDRARFLFEMPHEDIERMPVNKALPEYWTADE